MLSMLLFLFLFMRLLRAYVDLERIAYGYIQGNTIIKAKVVRCIMLLKNRPSVMLWAIMHAHAVVIAKMYLDK